ncbi:MAG TPA: 50S ribosomal protein L29 [Candidatus Nanoarchaeia archaeon]|nr:50S ribosomal protein L29 [Candidatus Nanoarchaeia archaeon]
MSKTELEGKMLELRKELMKVNSQRAIGTLPKSPGKVKEMKRTIAQIYTLNHEHTLKSSAAKVKAGEKQKGGSKKA